MQQESYHNYMARRMKEEDNKMNQTNAMQNAERSIFLGYPHRHIFHFRVQIEVFHDDRDIEFIQFKRWLERLYSTVDSNTAVLDLDYKSCEMIADDLYNEISAKYPGRFVVIDVSEDGENGCQIVYPKS